MAGDHTPPNALERNAKKEKQFRVRRTNHGKMEKKRAWGLSYQKKGGGIEIRHRRKAVGHLALWNRGLAVHGHKKNCENCKD